MKKTAAPSFQTETEYLNIAGISFVVLHDKRISLRPNDPAYIPFCIYPEKFHTPSCIRIRLHPEKIPSMGNAKVIFATGQSWSMYRRKNEYCLSLHPPHFASPLWIAVFSPAAMQVDVYGNDFFTQNRSQEPSADHPICYPLDQILLMHFMARRWGILMHAAGLIHKKNAAVFAGPSGAGKSTLSRLFVDHSRHVVASDERMVVRKIKGDYFAFGTPWPGTEAIAKNQGAPLAKMFLLKHGKKNHIQKISPKEALARLLPVTSIPWYDHALMASIIATIKDLTTLVPAYELQFQPEKEAVRFISDILRPSH